MLKFSKIMLEQRPFFSDSQRHLLTGEEDLLKHDNCRFCDLSLLFRILIYFSAWLDRYDKVVVTKIILIG